MRTIALLLALVTGFAFAATAATPALPAKEWTAIRKVVSDQLAALKAGDGAKAMTFAAPGIQAKLGTPENFLRMVRGGYSALLDARHTQFLEGKVVDDEVVQPLRLVLPDDTVRVAIYTMQRQADGAWRIAGCVIAPSTVQST